MTSCTCSHSSVKGTAWVIGVPFLILQPLVVLKISSTLASICSSCSAYPPLPRPAAFLSSGLPHIVMQWSALVFPGTDVWFPKPPLEQFSWEDCSQKGKEPFVGSKVVVMETMGNTGMQMALRVCGELWKSTSSIQYRENIFCWSKCCELFSLMAMPDGTGSQLFRELAVSLPEIKGLTRLHWPLCIQFTLLF